MNKRLSFLIFFLLTVVTSKNSIKVPLNPNFVLTVDSCPGGNMNGKIMNTTIPTSIHLDLFRNKLIEDPFFSNSHQNILWLTRCNATYRQNITFPSQTLQRQVVELVFEGIDTYSQIYLNSQLIVQTKNAFIEYRVEIQKNKIHASGNLLQVKLMSSITHDEIAQGQERLPFQYAQTRKPAYQYGWDWAPNINTIGIWKPIYSESYTNLKIDYVWARNHKISEKEALLNFAIALKNKNVDINEISGYNIQITNLNNQMKIQKVLTDIKYNYFDVSVMQPRFWWPNGIGEPYLYVFEVKLIRIAGNETIDNKTVEFGIRTTQLNRENEQFTVIINGYNIYCKGANYVPADMFYPRTINPDYTPGNTFQNLLNDAVQSHFNMIRIWGGGHYQSQQFLSMASRKGIMIFYDFMFSDSIYPANDPFLANFEIQIKQQLIKARNYPCVVLWSGNNQILQGIMSWGWKKPNYEENYRILFEEFIPRVLKKYHPDVPYIPSSPVNGVGNAGFSRGGDVHYWGVWAAQSKFQSYKNSIGPFNSQFGTQGIPVWETVINFTNPDQRDYESQGFKQHEKHGSRFATLRKYILLYAHRSKDFQSEVYLSGLIQAFGVELAIKYQRMAKPNSYGTLYWQLNDAWPAISWSSIDYFGRWKPLQYMAKRSYPDVAIFSGEELNIHAINDNLYPIQALVLIRIQNFNGQILLSEKKTITLQANQVKEIMKIQKNDYRKILNEIVLYTEIVAGREKEMWSTTFFEVFKNLKLEPSKLYVKLNKQFNLLVLRTDKFIKNLYISHSEKYLKLSDNYFDMIADKEYKVILDPAHKLSQIADNLLFRSYIQIHDNEALEVIYENDQ